MSRQTDDNLTSFKQDNFADGLVKNAPHEDIPQYALAGLVNAHAFATECQPRLASWLWSELQPPAWQDDCADARTGYVFMKEQDIVTCNDPIFDQGFVSCYIAWPTDDGFYHDEITVYLDANRVRVSLSGDMDWTNGCYVHGRMNVNSFHKRMRRKIWQWGNRVYTSPLNYSRWNECLCVSRRKPSNVISAWDEIDDDGIMGNTNGIFRLCFDGSRPMLWRANGPVPTVLLDGRQRRRIHKKRYDYLVSMCRLSSQGLRDRSTKDVEILQQSGTTLLNLDVTPNRDYSTYWTEKPIGDNRIRTGCKLTCGDLSDAYKDPHYYRTIPAPGASFKFTHNDIEEEFLVDMSTTGNNVESMNDVATSIQAAIRTRFPWIQVEYNEDGYFEFSTGEEENASISYLGAGTNGTNIASILQATEGDGATLDNSWALYNTNQVGTLTIPTDQGNYEWHWSHYTVWRTTNISADGADPKTTDAGEELPPGKFTWDGDYRVAAAFYADKEDGIVTAEIGTFEKADEGTPLRWEDGDVDTIIEYLNARQVRVDAEYYGGSSKSLQACAIGGGRVMRGSQNGDIVTLETVYNTDVIGTSPCDLRKTIYWSSGYTSVITEVLSTRQFRVHNSATRATQGFTLDPRNRVFTDIITDETLRNRMDEKHIGLLNMRFKEPMPNCNILTVVPGFMITGKRGTSTLPYCDLANNLKYNAGYYLPRRQTIDKVEGSIQIVRKAPNYFIVWCNNSLWGGPTNNPDINDLPEFGEWYGVLHADIIDPYIGAVDWGSIEEVDFGTFELICQDMGVRQLVNRKYTEDFTYNSLGQDIISKDLKECWNLGAAAYGRTLGHVFWLTEK